MYFSTLFSRYSPLLNRCSFAHRNKWLNVADMCAVMELLSTTEVTGKTGCQNGNPGNVIVVMKTNQLQFDAAPILVFLQR